MSCRQGLIGATPSVFFKYLKGVKAVSHGSVAALVEAYQEMDGREKRAANLPVSQRFFYKSSGQQAGNAGGLTDRHKSIQLRLGDARLLTSSHDSHIGNLNAAHPLFYADTSPRQAGLCAPLVQQLYRLRIRQLTELQGALVPLILKGKHVIAHAETGSGKSFGIALAVVNRLLREQINYRLHTLIIVPTEELSLQYEKWIRHFGGGSSQVVQVAIDSIPLEVQLGRLHNIQPHVLVGTPQRVAELNHLAPSFLNEKLRRKVDCLVIDEADIVLSTPVRWRESEGREVEADGSAIVERLFRNKPEEVPAQLIAASATVDSVTARLLNTWTRNDAAVRLTSSFSEHSIPSNIIFYFFGAKPSFPCSKCLDLVLRLIVKESNADRARVRVLLVTSKEEVEPVTLFLSEEVAPQLPAHNYSRIAAPLYTTTQNGKQEGGATGQRVTGRGRNSFYQPSPRIWRHGSDVYVKDDTVLSSFVEGELLVGVTHFEQCRGLHVNGVTHVILYGMSPSPTSFLHCAGRTGRMGREGKVIVLFPPSSGRLVQQVCDSVEIPFSAGKIEEVEKELLAETNQVV